MLNKLECYQLTTVGDREMNQDSMAHHICSEYGLFVVADGLGGHYGGEKASKFFCQGLFRQATKYLQRLKIPNINTKEVMSEWIDAAIDDMAVLFSGDANAYDAHTTAVVLYLDQNIAAVVHCGDSRIYRLNENHLIWRTKDHSLIQKQLDEGEITEREMGLHPEQNQLTRTINILKNYNVEVNIYPPIKQGETFILCSDGFWEFIKEKDLLQLAAPVAGRDELRKTARMMHLRAQGKSDNITVQWIRYS